MNRLCLLLLVLLVGCFKESQGNMRSVGVPGEPSWSAKTPASAQNSSATAAPGASTQPLLLCPPVDIDVNGSGVWLHELDRWREMTGLRGVRENPRMSQGNYAHARYLVKAGPPDDASFIAYRNSIGAAAHREDANSPFYSAEGADAANGGKVTIGGLWAADVSWDRNQCDDVRGLLVAPFHRLSLLAPWATVAGYGAFGNYPRRAAALALWGIPQDSGGTGQVEFPPDGSTLAIAAMNNSEWPNPLTSCPGYVRPVGLPISLQMGSPADWRPFPLAISLQMGNLVRLESFSLRDVTKDDPVEACAFDAFTYRNLEAAAQASGSNALRLYRAVVLIPRYPLRPGHRYAVGIKTHGHAVNWTFGIAASAVIRAPLISGEPLR